MSKWGGRLAAPVLGAPPALAFPRPGLWWLALVGLVPVLLLAMTAPGGREGIDEYLETKYVAMAM